jgi:hypothetical protein
MASRAIIGPVLVAGAALAALGRPTAASAAVISNGSFESGALSPWVQDQGTGSWAISTSVAESGSDSAAGTGNAELKQTFAPVPAATIASLSFWLEHPAPGVTTDAYNLYYSDGTTVQNYAVTTNTGFDLFDVTSRLNTAKTLIGIGFWGTTLGVTYLDNVSLTLAAPVPEAPTAAILAGALLGLGMVRRRT